MARYVPGVVPQEAAQLPEFLRSELTKIANAMETASERVSLDTLYAAPSKYMSGDIVKADGVTWNPGAGSGVYCYRDGAWHLLG